MHGLYRAFCDLYDARCLATTASEMAEPATVTAMLATAGADSLRAAEDWLAARGPIEAGDCARRGAATLIDALMAADGTTQSLVLSRAATLALHAVASVDALAGLAP